MLALVKLFVAAAALAFAGQTPGSSAQDKAVLGQSQDRQIVTFKEDVTPEQRKKLIADSNGTIVKELPFIDGYVVTFQKTANKQAAVLKARTGVEYVEKDVYQKWIEAAVPAAVNQVPLPAAGAALRQAKESATAPAVPPAAEAKAGSDSSDNKLPWGVERVHAPKVWDTTTGQGVKVCVIDTGIDYTHPALSDNYKGGYNVLDGSDDPRDDHGHGTHVAGTIAARPAGSVKVVGVAPGASLYGVKVLDAQGKGKISDIIQGITWAAENGMNIANMSLGGGGSDAMHKAVKKAVSAGVTIIAASGNDPEASISAPASYPEVIAISASASDDSLATFSTTGPEVAFIMPGHQIVSTWPGGKYAKLSGTSMASPHAAGLAALAVSMGASTPAKVRAAMQRAAVPLDGLQDNQQGAGMVMADRLVR